MTVSEFQYHVSVVLPSNQSADLPSVCPFFREDTIFYGFLPSGAQGLALPCPTPPTHSPPTPQSACLVGSSLCLSVKGFEEEKLGSRPG